IAGVLDNSKLDSIEAHIKDTLQAGGNIGDEKIIRMVVEEAGHRILDLINEGVRFDISDTGEYDLAMEGGHQKRRILHAKDATGAEIERALISACHIEDNITIYEDCLALDLILEDRFATTRKVVGLWCLPENGSVFTLQSTITVLATGGAGQLWRQTTNPEVATGDGIAMAVRAGAAVQGLEFVQFHPTAYSNGNRSPFLISEAVRGDGAILMTKDNIRQWKESMRKKPNTSPAEFSFTLRTDKRGSLATRDIVARAADAELKRSGEMSVFLVTEHLDEEKLKNRYPTINQKMKENGLNFGSDPIPVSPAAHYIVGGLAVNEWGEVKQRVLDSKDQTCSELSGNLVEGLFAIGETAHTGLHGANRLASNSLLEAVVFSHRAGAKIVSKITPNTEEELGLPDWRADGLDNLGEHAPLVTDKAALRSTMSDDVGLVKNDARLLRATRRLTLLENEVDLIWRRCLPSRELVELRNMAQVAKMVTAASLARRENIGLHFNQDLT
ncbi:MAG: FAD-binding protein, partial [Euryarchaeota archaeon]|nr:FAD-binding protein [Euryarchaeota archaeon]